MAGKYGDVVVTGGAIRRVPGQIATLLWLFFRFGLHTGKFCLDATLCQPDL